MLQLLRKNTAVLEDAELVELFAPEHQGLCSELDCKKYSRREREVSTDGGMNSSEAGTSGNGVEAGDGQVGDQEQEGGNQGVGRIAAAAAASRQSIKKTEFVARQLHNTPNASLSIIVFFAQTFSKPTTSFHLFPPHYHPSYFASPPAPCAQPSHLCRSLVCCLLCGFAQISY